MAVSRALRRLLRVLELQEEQANRALEAAVGELRRLQNALAATIERGRKGRGLVAGSAHSGELTDRLAGLAEAQQAGRGAEVLKASIAEAERNAAARRQEFLDKRTERRQAETLIREAEARDALQAGRRSQQSLDDWYLNRRHRREQAAESQAGASPPGEKEPNAPAEET